MTRHAAIAAFAAVTSLTLLVAVSSCKGCNQDEDIPEMPAAQPVQSPPPLELQPEDTGVDVDVETAGGKKRPGRSVSRLLTCCRVLASNAAGQPNLMVKGSMIQAASVCESAARNGDYRAVDDSLRQFNIPCR